MLYVGPLTVIISIRGTVPAGNGASLIRLLPLELVFSLVQLCASATGKPLADDELRLIAGYPRQLALLFPGMVPGD